MSERNLELETLTNDDVLKLKEFFKDEINSNRRFEEISTVEELLNVLDDRLALTDDVLSKLEPNFQKFIQSQQNKLCKTKKLTLPETVVTLICDNCSEREKFGLDLKLSEKQISQCQNVEDVLMKFVENCEGISHQEMVFRLNRALEKCGKASLKSMVVELMRE